MRSLEEWTRYLERQEQALKESKSGELAENKEEKTPATEDVAVKDKHTKTDASETKASASALPKTKVAVKSRLNAVANLTSAGEEVAQRSYKPFRETREELLERLLDPELTLEETARLLNCCPTTVRRYTNKGILKHIRTGGNQRRFKLSDVLEFLESRKAAGSEE